MGSTKDEVVERFQAMFEKDRRRLTEYKALVWPPTCPKGCKTVLRYESVRSVAFGSPMGADVVCRSCGFWRSFPDYSAAKEYMTHLRENAKEQAQRPVDPSPEVVAG